MAWLKAGNGNVFEVADTDHLAQIIKDSPLGEDGKPVHTAWQSDPRKKGAKPWTPGADDAPDSDSADE